MRRTKIVCTIGPASDDINVIKELIQAGMNVARLNFSHGTREEHGRRIASIRRAAAETGENIAVILDTEGPEIRLGYFEKEPVYLKEGGTVVLTTRAVKGDENYIPVNYPGLTKDVGKGDRILISDGLIELQVLSVAETEISCRVVNGGELTSQKGVNIPGVAVKLPSVTDKDIRDIKFGIEREVDFIACSFVRKPSDILAVREMIEEAGADTDIIAKIESRQAVQNLDDIIKVSDGVMVARGDLGVEIHVEEVPLLQKEIIEKCNMAGIPVITATQMLESMIANPRPTRAEASDVANAIFDGTDAIMLSGETAAGKYPVEAVETMARIAERAEAALRYGDMLVKKKDLFPEITVTDAISYATCTTAQRLGATAIITSTESGNTARMVSKYRPKAAIVAVTPHMRVLRKLALVWGVQPLLVGTRRNTDEMMATAVEAALNAGIVKGGDLVVITAGVPIGVRGTTNLIRVHTIGEIIAQGTGIGGSKVSGKVRIVTNLRDAEKKVESGDIIVTGATDKEYVPLIKKGGAVITETGGLTSHAAIVCLEFGTPVIVGVEEATSILKEGEVVTVDAQRGLVYRGAAKIL